MLGKVQTKIAGYKQQGTILYQKSVEMPGQVEASTQTEIKCQELRSKFLCLKRLFGSNAKIPRTRRWYAKINEKCGSTSKGTKEGY